MLDKLSGFLADMEKIDSSLNAARRAWDGAYNKLATGTGNLLGRAERLRAMGAKATRDLPSRFKGAPDRWARRTRGPGETGC